MKFPTYGLTPSQGAAVMAVFWFSLIAAVALAYAFRKWNRRSAHRRAVKRALRAMTEETQRSAR